MGKKCILHAERIFLLVRFKLTPEVNRRRNSSVGIASDYWLTGRSSIPGRGKRFLSTPQRPDRLWGPPSLLSKGYRQLLLRG
jgi:hypothetical protein